MKKIKFVVLYSFLVIVALIVISRIKYYIPNTPEYTIRIYLNSFASVKNGKEFWRKKKH